MGRSCGDRAVAGLGRVPFGFSDEHAACGASPEPAANGSAASAGEAVDAGSAPVVNPLGRARCRAPAGVSGSPTTTEEAIALLNALPKPTGVACFLESLDRPLYAYATSSVFSAQPALSAESPRVFLKLGSLWLSVVIDGDSSYLIEFGQRLVDAPLQSIKGELQLPLERAVSAHDPYERVLYGKGSVCGLCHYDEGRATSPPG